MNYKDKNLTPFYIAAGIAILVTILYISSGRGSLDLNVRQLLKNDTVKQVDTNNGKKIPITCKNGERYEIIFSEDRSNYDDLIFNACGSAGLNE